MLQAIMLHHLFFPYVVPALLRRDCSRDPSARRATDDDDEDMLEEDLLGHGNLNENEDDPIEDSLTQAPSSRTWCQPC
jgi:hypothetical protein